MPRISAKESSSSAWPTPDAQLLNDGEGTETFEARRQRNKAKGYNGNGQGTPMGMAVKLWPTPTTKDAASSGAAAYSTDSGRHSGTTLTDAIRMWATPNSRDHKGSDLPSRNGGTSLAEQAQTGRFSHRDPTTRRGPASSTKPLTSPLRLNPAFAAWLMGWPWWWTNTGPIGSARSEMASYLSRLRSLCNIYSESS